MLSEIRTGTASAIHNRDIPLFCCGLDCLKQILSSLTFTQAVRFREVCLLGFELVTDKLITDQYSEKILGIVPSVDVSRYMDMMKKWHRFYTKYGLQYSYADYVFFGKGQGGLIVLVAPFITATTLSNVLVLYTPSNEKEPYTMICWPELMVSHKMYSLKTTKDLVPLMQDHTMKTRKYTYDYNSLIRITMFLPRTWNGISPPIAEKNTITAHIVSPEEPEDWTTLPLDEMENAYKVWKELSDNK